MGWSRGTFLAEDIWNIVETFIPDNEKSEIAQEIVELFTNHDADDWSECTIYEAAYPGWQDEVYGD